MQTNRSKPRMTGAEAQLCDESAPHGTCLGCADCVGLCQAAIDVVVLPDIILTKPSDRS